MLEWTVYMAFSSFRRPWKTYILSIKVQWTMLWSQEITSTLANLDLVSNKHIFKQSYCEDMTYANIKSVQVKHDFPSSSLLVSRQV